ncbi:hypothetical protein ACLOJK_010204 [Asimina triloba]
MMRSPPKRKEETPLWKKEKGKMGSRMETISIITSGKLIALIGSTKGEILDDELWQEVGTGQTDGKERPGEEREGSR